VAIVIRFNVVVFPKAAVEAGYPGGLTRFRSDWTGSEEDEHLIAFTDMARHPIEDALTTEPFRRLPVAFGHALNGIVHGGDFLSWAEWCGVILCWLKGTPPGDAADFFEGSLKVSGPVPVMTQKAGRSLPE
jgi:hypothetical protein